MVFRQDLDGLSGRRDTARLLVWVYISHRSLRDAISETTTGDDDEVKRRSAVVVLRRKEPANPPHPGEAGG